MASGVRAVAQARGPAVAAGRRVQRRWLARFSRRYPLGAMAGIAILGLTAGAGGGQPLPPHPPPAEQLRPQFFPPRPPPLFCAPALRPAVPSRLPLGARPGPPG